MLPKSQLAILAACRFAEPIALTSVFPYLFHLIRSLPLTPPPSDSQIATLAGLASSTFSLGQVLTGLLWGSLSDSYGRKPVILLGLLGTCLTQIMFGMSEGVYGLIAARFLGGIVNGNVGVIRTVVAELVQERGDQAIAFSIMPIVWSTGSIIGPVLGGTLADPVSSYPTLFPKDSKLTRFFTRFRFALPNFVAAWVLGLSCLVGWLFLEETLETRRGLDMGQRVGRGLVGNTRRLCRCCCSRRSRMSWRRNHARKASTIPYPDYGEDEEGLAFLHQDLPLTSLPHSSSSNAPHHSLAKTQPKKNARTNANGNANAPPTSFSKTLFTPQITLNILTYSTLATHTISFDQIFPIYASTSPKSGGLGLSPRELGLILSMAGLWSMVLQVFVFPRVQRRMGSVLCLRFAFALYCVVYLFVPLTRLSLSPLSSSPYLSFLPSLPSLPSLPGVDQSHKDGSGTIRAGSSIATMCAVLGIQFGKSAAGVFAFPSSAILITNSVPHRNMLGSVNGLNQAIGSFCRMLGPVVFGYLLTISLERGVLYLVWSCLAGISAVAFGITLWIMEDCEIEEPVMLEREEERGLMADSVGNDEDDEDMP